jgi:UDP-glucose 4-epimerase
MAGAHDLGDYYRICPDSRDLNYGKYVAEGEREISEALDYNSHNTRRLDVTGTKELLLTLPFVRQLLAGEMVEPEA